MKHLTEKQRLLYLLESLSPHRQRQYQRHLNQCPACQKAINVQARELHAYQSMSLIEPAADTIENHHERLMDAVMREKALQNKPRASLFSGFSRSFSPGFSWAMAAGTLILGFALGRVFNLPSNRNEFAELMAHPISDIQVNFTSSKVEIAFTTLKSHEIEGALTDPQVQQLLSYTLMNDHRDNIRLKSVNLLEEAVLQESPDDEFLQSALIHTLEHDTNPGVRLKALRLMAKVPVNNRVKKALLFALFNDSVSGIRNEAARILNSLKDTEIEAVLKHRALSDEYVNALVGTPAMQRNKEI